VRFLLAEDRGGDAFRLAPLGGATMRAAIDAARRDALPDSMVVVTASGDLLTRSRAVRHLLQRLGGLWRVAAVAAGLCPTWLLDRLYDGIAAVRLRLFARPAEACPFLPPRLRARFDA
jgi:predicted DCC family thiol-disulfide oxidoreductase YuxK